MIQRLRWFLRKPFLQRRIGFLTGVAVAVAVAVTGLAGFLTAQRSLYDQIDRDLLQVATQTADTIGQNIESVNYITEQSLRPANLTIVLLRSDGYTVRVPGQRTTLEVGDTELALARLQERSSKRTGRSSEGERYRIVAVPAPQLDGKYALVIGRPLAPTEETLRNLRLALLLVGSIGAALGAVIGTLIARSAMRPVRELTRRVTLVTQTDSLDAIEVEGDDEVSQLTRSFNTMLYSLASSRARQNRLIADASHELRTPLTSLRTNIELLVADEKSGMLPAGARREILSDIAAQLAEFTSLISDLVQLTRDAEGAPRGPLDLKDVVTNAIERARRRGPGIDFDVRLTSRYLVGESDQLERAITNLLDNAVKFSPPDGTIRVVLDGEHLRISDQGPGIAEDDLPHIFDRFYRSEKARNTPGTGLGLSIVAQTVMRHHGWVRASRSTEGGAEFTVWLPGHDTIEDLHADPRMATG
ncbi:MAG: HAMP domain-containing sensor histidine kinase [Propionibacteriaceae bacterium]|nr:HAMP domain-containing sensor histidine kinase [Propionibacteriaceae bacterium]